ncbi:MAG: GGDEF domain-containing response regulator [Candidatus Atribacteria bacterium]|nr:MAG: GGDEF domain-containing response regulator [Candidatus Atribacteria bacterium]
MKKRIRILLVEDNLGDASIVQDLLREAEYMHELTTVARVRDCMRLIDDKLVDMILLDLSLPDSDGLQGLHRLRAHAPEIPIIILTGFSDIDTAEQAVRSGAQDYLVKGHLEGNLLHHAVKFAELRHAFRTELEELSLRDPLTGLYNRRGFRLLADQSLRVAKRNGRDSVLLLADMNDLKDINDTYGHLQGDLALRGAARAFKHALRDSDIIGRLGGDEFVALAVEANPPGISSLFARLLEQIEVENTKLEMSLPLSLSIGVAPFSPREAPSLNDLIVAADRDMYEKKREYRRRRDGG